MKGLFLFCALLVGLYWLWENSEISHPAGIVAPDEPHQREVYSAFVREKDGYRIMPLATFDIRARVIARERYRFARAAESFADRSGAGLGRNVRYHYFGQNQFFPRWPRLHLDDECISSTAPHHRNP
jgi:hypothetical protein